MRQAYDYWQDQPGSYRRTHTGTCLDTSPVLATSARPTGPGPTCTSGSTCGRAHGIVRQGPPTTGPSSNHGTTKGSAALSAGLPRAGHGSTPLRWTIAPPQKKGILSKETMTNASTTHTRPVSSLRGRTPQDCLAELLPVTHEPDLDPEDCWLKPCLDCLLDAERPHSRAATKLLCERPQPSPLHI